MTKYLVNAGILGVGACIPETVRKNDYWDHIVLGNLPQNSRNPFEGIEERRVFPEDTVPSDIEAEAGRLALQDAGISPEEIDLVMVQSMIQDEILPGNASLVQHKLGLSNAGAWNIDTCCSSFVTAVVNASNLVAAGEFKKILVITSALNSQLSDFSDYLCINLGDGAGAAVIGQVSENRGYLGSYCISDGQYHKAFTLVERMPYNVTRSIHYKASPIKPVLTTDPVLIRQTGKESVKNMGSVLKRVLEKVGVDSGDIGLFLSHQPCYWAHDAWRESINVPKDKSYETFAKYGNIASASIPVNLFEAKQKGLLKDGDYLMLASSGAGENHIAAVLRWEGHAFR